MSVSRDKILIVGGYGAVGTIVSKDLAIRFPGKVLIAGRNKHKALAVIGQHNLDALPIELDLNSGSFGDIDFNQVHTAISCIEYLRDDNFIHACIKGGVHYTELATSYEAYQRLINYGEEVEESKICLIPGVGLMPGLSGVFVQNAIAKLQEIRAVESFILLGLGENHGLDAIRWMLKFVNKTFTLQTEEREEQVKSFADPVEEQLLSENRPRKFYRFDFGDQHIIKEVTEVDSAQTRLAFDSRAITWLIAKLRKVGLLNKVSKINPQSVKRWLDMFRFGSEQFAVQTHCYGRFGDEMIFLAEGFNEANATGKIAAYAVALLYESNKKTGIRRFEEVVEFNDFTQYLRENQINVKVTII